MFVCFKEFTTMLLYLTNKAVFVDSKYTCCFDLLKHRFVLDSSINLFRNDMCCIKLLLQTSGPDAPGTLILTIFFLGVFLYHNTVQRAERQAAISCLQ